MRWILFFSLGIFIFSSTFSQENNREKRMRAKVSDGDTIILGYLNTVYINENWNPRRKKRYTKRYLKLIRDVKKAYPFAKLAGDKLKEYEAELSVIEKARNRRKFLDKVEKELRQEYGEDIKNLTITQGVILIKLVDRETGDTSYELLKQFRGSFSAFFWQGVARLFGHNLKLNYDPNGDDYLIEEVVQLIEQGKI